MGVFNSDFKTDQKRKPNLTFYIHMYFQHIHNSFSHMIITYVNADILKALYWRWKNLCNVLFDIVWNKNKVGITKLLETGYLKYNGFFRPKEAFKDFYCFSLQVCNIIHKIIYTSNNNKMFGSIFLMTFSQLRYQNLGYEKRTLGTSLGID